MTLLIQYSQKKGLAIHSNIQGDKLNEISNLWVHCPDINLKIPMKFCQNLICS